MTRPALYAVLLIVGAIWGLSIVVTKVAVSTGYGPFGLIFWQLIIAVTILGAILIYQGKSLRFQRSMLGALIIVGLIGTIIPNTASYSVAFHLPAGVMALILALVPMFALPVALAFGQERPEKRRFIGVILGAIAVSLIVLPSTSLPGVGLAVFVLIGLISPLCYGLEGNYVAWRGTDGLDAIQLLFGASLVSLVFVTPTMILTDQVISPFIAWGTAEWSILANGVLHAVAYPSYIWLVRRGGAVFASQVSYLVTGAGVLWSILLLSERYSLWVWAALVVMILGLVLVQPKATSRADA